MPEPSPLHPLWPDASLEELMALARQKYDLAFEPVSAGGVTLEIVQIANMKDLLDRAIAENALADAVRTLPLWAKIWPASVILGHVLQQALGKPFAATVLEIGAGCGVTGLVAAALGARRVCITDINEDALLFARINALRNGLGERTEVRRVDIAHDTLGERFSVIIGSEILYLEPLYRPLVKFLQRHLEKREGAAAYLATDHRRNARPFFKRAEKEFSISSKQIGVTERSACVTGGQDQTDDTAASTERHLLTIHRLTALSRPIDTFTQTV